MPTINPAVLVTIPVSHFCEKARWALDRVALPYREEPHVALLHRLATTRNGGGTVPLLIHNSSRLTDSTAIIKHADSTSGGELLYPREAALRLEVDAMMSRFDVELGMPIRRWAYEHLLPDTKQLRQMWSRGVQRLEAGLVPLIVPIARRLVRRAYRITPQSAQRSLQHVHQVFREIDERLSDGRRFLIGNRFTAADLTFAALAAPILFPLECRAALPSIDEVQEVMRDEILRLRATAAGQFALRLYAEERG